MPLLCRCKNKLMMARPPGFLMLLAFFLAVVLPSGLYAQILEGIIRDQAGKPLAYVNLAVKDSPSGTSTNEAGFFRLRVPPGKDIQVYITYLGYEPQTLQLMLRENETRWITIELTPGLTPLPDVVVTEKQILSTDITRIDPKLAILMPGPGSSIEGLIKTLPGVMSASELSSQYSVRGGNFDENLVYVNGIEIYRPFLIRSGQQEGLSFLNSDLVTSIRFSAGGFEARYGDKMSSVLDITYKEPQTFAGSFSMSLLEGSVHLEGRGKATGLGYLIGIRHKSNQYLLGTLDTKGDYKPSFSDIQTLISYPIGPKSTLSFLGNYSANRYLFRPKVQSTRFGTLTDVRQFTVYFDGQEVDRFNTAFGALTYDYKEKDRLHLSINASLFRSDEQENFDIIGQYWLQRVETDFGKDDFGQAVGEPLGVGTFFNHARNALNAIVANIGHQGKLIGDKSELAWGFRVQYEDILDRLHEWSLIDSAGYIIPRRPPNAILLRDTLSTRITLSSMRYSGFLQHSWNVQTPKGRYAITPGFRVSYWDYNRQVLFSPRITVLFKPASLHRWAFRGSAGYYHQPPFYRELRNLLGKLNPDIKAQESLHFVLGSEYNFNAWDRPFKFTSEAYYKRLRNLIPYELDNVRIRYYAENSASGYAAGLDLKINGEFVPGVESWASLSVMDTREKIDGAWYIDAEGNRVAAGYIPRPTDQRLNFSLFFQDFLPRNPSYKVQIGFVYGSGLPFGPPGFNRQLDTLRMPSYKRVDIGFSKLILGEERRPGESSPLRHFESMWITAEVFNLLEINNTISYLWIKDVENRMFAIPNYLTSRLINIKLVARF